MLRVLLTVPHHQGCESFTHLCDAEASRLAMTLEKEFKAAGISVDVMLGNIPRAIIDLNRIESRNTPFRHQIQRWVQMYRGPRWVIDCHSFPFDYEWSQEADANFIILDTWPTETSPTLYVSNIIDKLRRNGVNVIGLRGARAEDDQTNDIMDTARSAGARSFLLEMREGTSETTLQRFAREIVDVLRDM